MNLIALTLKIVQNMTNIIGIINAIQMIAQMEQSKIMKTLIFAFQKV